MATAGKPRPIDERRAQFKRYKEDVKKRGKPFYPYAMFHEHGDEPRRRVDDRRARNDLEVDLLRAASRRHAPGPPRARVHRTGRSRHDELRAAPRLVLLLPLLSPPDLQMAGDGVPRHGGRAEHLPRAAARTAVHRPAAGAAAVAAPGRPRRLAADDPLDGGSDVEGRDGEGGSRLGGDHRGAELGQGREAPAGGGSRREALRGVGLHRVSYVCSAAAAPSWARRT